MRLSTASVRERPDYSLRRVMYENTLKLLIKWKLVWQKKTKHECKRGLVEQAASLASLRGPRHSTCAHGTPKQILTPSFEKWFQIWQCKPQTFIPYDVDGWSPNKDRQINGDGGKKEVAFVGVFGRRVHHKVPFLSRTFLYNGRLSLRPKIPTGMKTGLCDVLHHS